MIRLFTRRAAILSAVGIAAIVGSTIAWLGTEGASGSVGVKAGSTLKFDIPSISVYCYGGSSATEISAEIFVVGPEGTFQPGATVKKPCGSGTVYFEHDLFLTVQSPAKGTYMVGIEVASSSADVTMSSNYTPVVTYNGIDQALGTSPADPDGRTRSESDMQLVTQFVFNPQLFTLGQG